MIHLISDTHFGHSNILRLCNRPFRDVQEMNEALVRNWNASVNHGDTVFHLGDFSMKISAMEQWFPKLNGKVILVAGNHDLIPGKKPQNLQRYFNAGFAEVHFELMMPVVINGKNKKLKLHHMPYAPPPQEIQEYDVRYLDLRPVPTGEDFLIHGHVHNAWKSKRHHNGRLQINVGVDQWGYAPIRLPDLAEFIHANSG